MLTELGTGLLLGLSLAAPPGPVNALIARQATLGWRSGVRAGLPAPIVDTGYMLLVLFGVLRLVDVHAIARPLAAVGACMMAFLAWAIAQDRPAKTLTGPMAVWAVTLTNPFQYAWWLSAGAAFLAATGGWGVLGFLVAIFGWVLAFSFLVARGASRWDWFAPLLQVVSADVLVVFALRLALDAA